MRSFEARRAFGVQAESKLERQMNWLTTETLVTKTVDLVFETLSDLLWGTGREFFEVGKSKEPA